MPGTGDKVINQFIQCLEASAMCPELKQILRPYSVPGTMTGTGNEDP